MRKPFSKLFLSSILMLSLPMVAGSCIQPVDSNASKDVPTAQVRTEDFTPITTIEPTDRPIQLAPEDEEMVTADPCVKTKSDKDDILKVYCGGCHQAPGNSGQPIFDFVLDESRLLTETVPRDGALPQAFVLPGQPAQSLLYTRVASRSMPPPSRMLGVAAMPAPTLSDISVLADWIANCAPGAKGKTPTPASTGGTSGTGGAMGTGGSTGTGGATRPGTGGSTGTGGAPGGQATGGSTVVRPDAGVAATGGSAGPDAGGGAPDAGTGSDAGVMACANNVANGANCMQQPTCQMGNLVCTCAGAAGARRWACR